MNVWEINKRLKDEQDEKCLRRSCYGEGDNDDQSEVLIGFSDATTGRQRSQRLGRAARPVPVSVLSRLPQQLHSRQSSEESLP
ncbi:unnamed protein product, partial [Protopolystoma xenopodis]